MSLATNRDNWLEISELIGKRALLNNGRLMPEDLPTAQVAARFLDRLVVGGPYGINTAFLSREAEDRVFAAASRNVANGGEQA